MECVPETISAQPSQPPTPRLPSPLPPEKMEPQSHQESTTPLEGKTENKPFKDLVHNFMEYTTAHGIGRLAASQTLFWKIFWSLTCIGAFIMFTYQGTELFQQYLSKPVATTMSVTFEKVRLNGKLFCNHMVLRT